MLRSFDFGRATKHLPIAVLGDSPSRVAHYLARSALRLRAGTHDYAQHRLRPRLTNGVSVKDKPVILRSRPWTRDEESLRWADGETLRASPEMAALRVTPLSPQCSEEAGALPSPKDRLQRSSHFYTERTDLRESSCA